MKKILFAFIAFGAMILSSCSNEDIEISKVGSLYNLTYNISPQGMYDEFDISGNVREILREQNWALGITTFAYDKEGGLVEKKFSYQYNFNTVSEEFENLLEGEYTFVTIETLVDPDLDYEADDWTIKGEENLSTLEISQDSHQVFYPFAVGVSTNKVNVSDNNSITIAPKAIGSMLQLSWLNFDKSTHVKVGFATKDIIDTYKLDPSLSRTDRYNTDITSIGYLNVRADRNIGGSDRVEATRYVLEKSMDGFFCYQKKENEGSSTWSYRSGDVNRYNLEDGKTYYAGIQYIDASTFTFYFGDYAGYAQWEQNLSVPKDVELGFKAPSIQWGASVSTVKNYMSGYTLSNDIQQVPDGTYGLQYEGKDSEAAYLYFFKNKTGVLLESDVYFDASEISADVLNGWLRQNGYEVLSETANTSVFISSDYKTIAMVLPNADFMVMAFVDYEYFASLSGLQQKKMIADCQTRKISISKSQTIAPKRFEEITTDSWRGTTDRFLKNKALDYITFE